MTSYWQYHLCQPCAAQVPDSAAVGIIDADLDHGPPLKCEACHLETDQLVTMRVTGRPPVDVLYLD